jgi:hypothetical protein
VNAPTQLPLPGMELYAATTHAHWTAHASGSHQPPTAAGIARDTGGVLRPSFAVIPRLVAHLVRGDVMVEPILGEVRVVYVAEFGYDEVRHQPLCQVHWVSDNGLSTAACSFPSTAAVGVRVPAPADVHMIRRAIAIAARHQREIDPCTARLIAAQLQRGPGSALYAFAVSSIVTDRLYDELDEVRPDRPSDLARWVDALTHHCLNRTDHRRAVQPPPGSLTAPLRQQGARSSGPAWSGR